MSAPGTNIKVIKLFDAETINNSTATSKIIPLKDLAVNGYFAVQVGFNSTPAGAPSVDIKLKLSINGEDFLTPSGVADIATAHVKGSGPGADGKDIYSFSPKPGAYMQITITETASAAGDIDLWLLVQ